MADSTFYKKGDKVTVQIPIEGGATKVHSAEFISEVANLSAFNQEMYVNIRFLDVAGMQAYRCVPRSWVTKQE